MTKDRIKIFGTDGVRGRANELPMTVEVALALGRAAGKIFRRHNGKHKVVIGKDTRLSCYMFENALIAGLCSMGVDTLMLGPFPTPGVAFITRAYRADAGIVISASHNQFTDNGIKFFSSDGFKLPDEVEKEMEELVWSGDFSKDLPAADAIGRNSRVRDADGRYIEYVKATYPKQLSLQGLKIALDCSNGAGYKIAPHIFSELDATVFVYGDEPNGMNINRGCGSLHTEMIQMRVIDHHADVGIALDGDADRVILIDEHAQIVDGDTIMAILAKDMQQKGKLKNNKLVATVMSNYGLFKAMRDIGVDVVTSRVGDRYVIQDMRDHGAILGGEQSGHLICLEHNTTGDALIAALQVLAIMVERDMPLSELARVIEKYPQTLLNIPVSQKPPLESLETVSKAIHAVETALKGDGRVLVRYSGTENICRVLVEGSNSKKVDAHAQTIAHAITEAIGV